MWRVQNIKNAKKSGGRGPAQEAQQGSQEEKAIAMQDLSGQPGTPDESETEDASLQGASGEGASPQPSSPPGAEASAPAWPGPSSALPLQGSSDLRARSSLKSSSGRSTPTSTMERGDRPASPPRDTSADREASGQAAGATQDENSDNESEHSQPFFDARETQGGRRSLGARILDFLRRGTERMSDRARLYVTLMMLFVAVAGFLMCWMYDNEPLMLYSAAAFFLVFCMVFCWIWCCLGLQSNNM